VVRQWAQRVDDLREKMTAVAHDAIHARINALRLLQARLGAHHPARELERRRGHLVQLSARLRALGPQATLDRGYALVLDHKDHPITKAVKPLEGQPARIVLGKGALEIQVTQAHPQKTLMDVLAPKPLKVASTPAKKGKPKRKTRRDPSDAP
jgi:exodeoxyribonuclease VII large subunit